MSTEAEPAPGSGTPAVLPSAAPANCNPADRVGSSMPRRLQVAGTPDDLLRSGDTFYLSLLDAGKIVALRGPGEPTTIASGLSSPEGLAPAPNGDLYVVEQGKNRVDRVSLDGKVTPLHTFPNPAGKLGIDTIRALDNGDLLVPNSPVGEIDEYTPATNAVRVIARGLGRPVDVLPFDGGYAVADESRGLLQVSATGAVTRLADISIPDDLVLAPDGTLFVTSIGSQAVYRYRAGAATVISTGLGDPQGLALDADGSLLVSDGGLEAVLVLARACLG